MYVSVSRIAMIDAILAGLMEESLGSGRQEGGWSFTRKICELEAVNQDLSSFVDTRTRL